MTVSRHDRENAARDLARDLSNATGGGTRLPWTLDGLWSVSREEAKFDLVGVDGLSARVTIHVSGVDDD